jgi:hypothetical protein
MTKNLEPTIVADVRAVLIRGGMSWTQAEDAIRRLFGVARASR